MQSKHVRSLEMVRLRRTPSAEMQVAIFVCISIVSLGIAPASTSAFLAMCVVALANARLTSKPVTCPNPLKGEEKDSSEVKGMRISVQNDDAWVR